MAAQEKIIESMQDLARTQQETEEKTREKKALIKLVESVK